MCMFAFTAGSLLSRTASSARRPSISMSCLLKSLPSVYLAISVLLGILTFHSSQCLAASEEPDVIRKAADELTRRYAGMEVTTPTETLGDGFYAVFVVDADSHPGRIIELRIFDQEGRSAASGESIGDYLAYRYGARALFQSFDFSILDDFVSLYGFEYISHRGTRGLIKKIENIPGYMQERLPSDLHGLTPGPFKWSTSKYSDDQVIFYSYARYGGQLDRHVIKFERDSGRILSIQTITLARNAGEMLKTDRNGRNR